MLDTGYRNYEALSYGVLLVQYSSDQLKTLYGNDAAANATGYDKDDFQNILRENPLGFLTQPDALEVMNHIAAVHNGLTCAECRLSSQRNAAIQLRLKISKAEPVFPTDVFQILIFNDLNQTPQTDRLQSIISTLPGCAVDVVKKENGVFITYWNETFIREIGGSYKAGIALTQNLDFPRVYPEDRPAMLNAYHRLLEGDANINVDFRSVDKDDRLLWLNLHLSSFDSRPGQRQYSGMITVIHDKMQEIEQLIKAKDEMEGVFYSLPVGIGVFQYADKIVKPIYFNERMHSIFGMSQDAFQSSFNSLTPFGIIREDSYQYIMQSYMENGRFKPFTSICEVKKSTDESTWVRIICSPALENSRLMIYVVLYDVSHVVKLSRSSQWECERYRILSNAAQIDIFDYDLESNVLSLSMKHQSPHANETVIPNADRFLHSTPDIHPDDKENLFRVLDEATRDEQSGNFEIRLRINQKSYRCHRAFYSSVKDEFGKVFRMVGRLEDIQNEKDMEALLHARLKMETLFYHPSTNATLALEYDLTLDERIPFEGEVAPGWIKKLSFVEMITMLRDSAVYADNKQIFDQIIRSLASCDNDCILPGISGEYQLRPPTSGNPVCKWYRVDLVYAHNDFNHHRHAFLKVADIQDQKEREKLDFQQLSIDLQTGLFNHDSFDRELALLLASPPAQQLPGGPLCVAMIGLYDVFTTEDSDWDRFRDEIIMKAARILKTWLRPNEMLGRYNVDEFSLLLCNEQDDTQMAERLRVLYTTLRLTLEEYSDLSVCIGYFTFSNANASAKKVIRKANRALYWAREQGGSALVPYSSWLDIMLRNVREDTAKPNPVDSENKTGTVSGSASDIFIRTFGHFDVFVKGKAVLFTNAKSKELLALLVDRGGGFLTASEAIAFLWESEPANDVTLARYRKVAMYLKNTLKANRAEDILEVINGKRRVNKEKFQCDYYLCMDSGSSIVQYYPSAYMVEYAWAENTISILEAMRQKVIAKQAG